ncbi:potassium channel, putative [Ixodes scapularis]|uniref:Potassium channel, putative n=1 Tax=Ixodes scapularis TaxID=6945 RepID=B7Q476_IXOSC|nr:potassium channel, putative [Ixodes scapularis]|eukprot:XP_002411493.1 potassium channel, putative [Ixodes scapularis]
MITGGTHRYGMCAFRLTKVDGLAKSAAYVSCSLGIHNVGFVMITFGLTDAIFSMVFGSIIKVVGRIPIFVFGAMVNAAIIMLLYLWKSSPEEPYVFFIIAGCWGLGDAVWQTQVNGE